MYVCMQHINDEHFEGGKEGNLGGGPTVANTNPPVSTGARGAKKIWIPIKDSQPRWLCWLRERTWKPPVVAALRSSSLSPGPAAECRSTSARAALLASATGGSCVNAHVEGWPESPECLPRAAIRWFGEASPEAEAAQNLQHFFTFVAVKIVSAQLESYNPEAYMELMEFLDRHSLNDGDKFCGSLMRESPRHQALALRIFEVRSAYIKQDFEWENLKKLAFKMVDESNTRLMREYILETSHLEDET